MKQNILKIYAIVIIVSVSSCSKQILGREKPNTQTENFQVLWQDFDEHYGTFSPKGIDWTATYKQFWPLVSNDISNDSLFHVCRMMLDVLNDDHVFLRPTKETGLPWYSGGILGRTKVEDYDRKVALSYLKNYYEYNKAIEYGLFQNNIGYINLKDLGNNINSYYKAMDDILEALKDTKGIVIEMRENGGGEDRVAQYIANRFAKERHLSFTVSLRNGPLHTDFGNPIQFFTSPEGNSQYTKPIVVLTDLNTFSSGETFVLAMLQNSNVKLVGDVTGGALSDAVERELSNGWFYRLPIADVRDANGKNLESIGIQPHIKVQNTKAELASGHDKALEQALKSLQ